MASDPPSDSSSESGADWNALRRDLAERIREVRRELYGEHGGPLLAEALKLPYRTWSSYEGGTTIPAPILLRFIELTSVDWSWLLTGVGDKFTRPSEDDSQA